MAAKKKYYCTKLLWNLICVKFIFDSYVTDVFSTLQEDYGAPVLNLNDHVVAMTISSSVSRDSPNYFLKIQHILELSTLLN